MYSSQQLKWIKTFHQSYAWIWNTTLPCLWTCIIHLKCWLLYTHTHTYTHICRYYHWWGTRVIFTDVRPLMGAFCSKNEFVNLLFTELRLIEFSFHAFWETNRCKIRITNYKKYSWVLGHRNNLFNGQKPSGGTFAILPFWVNQICTKCLWWH